MVTLSSASLVFIPSLHVGNANPIFAYAIVMLGFSVFYGVLFMALMTYFYEMFLYNPRNFGALQSSTMFSFGFSGLMCFGLPIL
jgi:hypothetical protein